MAENYLEPEYIGVAWMDDDGTINLRLKVGEAGISGEGYLTYPTNHPDYKMILDHVGPLKSGERRSVRPWTDPA